MGVLINSLLVKIFAPFFLKYYLLLEVLGTSGKKHRMFCWNAPDGSTVKPYSVVAVQLQNGDYGFSTNWRKVIELSQNKE